MSIKLISTFSADSNGETVNVNVYETEKGITVNIEGTAMDVLINSEEVYSKFDKPEYKKIPSHIRPFVEKHLNNYEDSIRIEDTKVCMSVDIGGTDYNMDIPVNRAKCKDIYISDWLESYDKIIGYDVEIPNAKENYEKLVKDINDIGYKFEYAWGGNEYDDIFKLVVPINKFDELKINECVILWKAYNKYLDKYIKLI